MIKLTRRQFLQRASIFGSMGLVASYPVFIERYIVLTNFYRIYVPNLPAAFSGLKIVQLTDLHYGFLVPLDLIRNVVERANRLKPDLIVCTGDYVHEKNSASQIDQVWPVLSELTAPMGVYSVLGNHDHWADTSRSDYWLRRTRQNLRHKSVRLERQGQHLWLVGAGDLWEDHSSLDSLLAGLPDTDCRVVLAHNPDTADTKHSSRIDLIVSGHTHGGQIDIPIIGPPVLPVRNKNYSSGLKVSPSGCKVFISKGIGWSIYPVRFNCYPEIAVLELVPEKA
ncbi:MAG TPA: metallophosphoesterase [Dissulfurispiraceae bacterium]|nr:metallophosphoesterase [Dissulfurispiraceae bacterium]